MVAVRKSPEFFRRIRLTLGKCGSSSICRTGLCRIGLDMVCRCPRTREWVWDRPKEQGRRARPAINKVRSGRRPYIRLDRNDGLGVGWPRILIWMRIWRQKGHREAQHERGLCLDAVAAGMSHRQTTWRRPRLGGRRITISQSGLTLPERGLLIQLRAYRGKWKSCVRIPCSTTPGGGGGGILASALALDHFYVD